MSLQKFTLALLVFVVLGIFALFVLFIFFYQQFDKFSKNIENGIQELIVLNDNADKFLQKFDDVQSRVDKLFPEENWFIFFS